MPPPKPKFVDPPKPKPEAGNVKVKMEGLERAVMEALDRNKDGRLSPEEQREFFKLHGAFWAAWTAARATDFADTNRDGFIDPGQEFHKFIDFCQARGYNIANDI